VQNQVTPFRLQCHLQNTTTTTATTTTTTATKTTTTTTATTTTLVPGLVADDSIPNSYNKTNQMH